MTDDDTFRSVKLTRLGFARYQATNARGARLEFSDDPTELLTPVELLLAAMAGCTAIDVDFIVSKRAEPTRFDVSATANKGRDEHGNHLVNLSMSFDVTFADDEGGRAAAEVLPAAVSRSHDRLCTVSRTIELGAPVSVKIAKTSED